MTGEETTRRTDLSRLLSDRKEQLDKSYRDLADACIDPEDPEAGPLYKRSTLENLAKGVVTKAPTIPQMRALKAGFQLPLGVIQEAAGAQFLGIDTVWSEDGRVRTLIHNFHELAPEDQVRVETLMESWRRLKRD